jgi:pimeloyl-ACP methyl ester carboxylesterase
VTRSSRGILWLRRLALLLTSILVIEVVSFSTLKFLGSQSEQPLPSIEAIEQDGKPPQAIIILVHGTFAPDAPWTQTGSALRNSILSHFDSVAVSFYQFNWLGSLSPRYNNTNLARYDAGRRLGNLLRYFRAKFPAAQVFIVAHSHGGNVALYGTQQAPEVKVKGIVTMGTPFIKVTPTRVNADVTLIESTKIVASAAWFALILGSELAGIAGLLLGVSLMGRSGFFIKVLAGIIILLSIGAGMWPFRADGVESVWVPQSSNTQAHSEVRTKWVLTEEVKQLRRDWANSLVTGMEEFAQRTQLDLSMKFTASAPLSAPVLCMRTTADDEAMMALGGIEPALELPASLLANPTLAVGIAGFLFVLCGLGSLVFGGWMFVGVLREAKANHELSFGLVAGTIFASALTSWWVMMGVSAVVALVLVVLAPLSILIRAPAAMPALIAYGSTDIIGEYFVHTEALKSPVASDGSSNDTCTPFLYLFQHVAGLRHSQYYADPQALEDLAAWLRHRYDDGPAL